MNDEQANMRLIGTVIGLLLFFVVANMAIQQFRGDASGFQMPGEASIHENEPIIISVLAEGNSAEVDSVESIESESTESGSTESGSTESGSTDGEVTESEVTESDATEDEVDETEDNAENDRENDAEAPIADESPNEQALSTDEPETAPATEEAPSAESDEAEPSAGPDVQLAFSKGACAGCHVIPGIRGAVSTIGPDLSQIGTIAASRVEGVTAQEYLNESLIEPDAYIVQECPTGPCAEGIMLPSFVEALSEAELDALVQYMLGLEGSE